MLGFLDDYLKSHVWTSVFILLDRNVKKVYPGV